jgi:hypothetical protein
MALQQWNFYIPGFICYLSGAFRNHFLLNLNSKRRFNEKARL